MNEEENYGGEKASNDIITMSKLELNYVQKGEEARLEVHN